MTGYLQRRLDAAREERRRAAERQAAIARQAFRPAPAAADAEGEADADDDVVIDLRTVWSVRDAARASRAARAARLPVPVGRAIDPDVPRTPLVTRDPTRERCPRCGGTVRLDMFDAVEAVAHLTCTDCHLLYTAKSPRA